MLSRRGRGGFRERSGGWQWYQRVGGKCAACYADRRLRHDVVPHLLFERGYPLRTCCADAGNEVREPAVRSHSPRHAISGHLTIASIAFASQQSGSPCPRTTLTSGVRTVLEHVSLLWQVPVPREQFLHPRACQFRQRACAIRANESIEHSHQGIVNKAKSLKHCH